MIYIEVPNTKDDTNNLHQLPPMSVLSDQSRRHSSVLSMRARRMEERRARILRWQRGSDELQVMILASIGDMALAAIVADCTGVDLGEVSAAMALWRGEGWWRHRG